MRKRLARRGWRCRRRGSRLRFRKARPWLSLAELMQATVHAMLFTIGKLPAGIVSANALACAKNAMHTMLLNKLKYGLALGLILLLLGGGARWALL